MARRKPSQKKTDNGEPDAYEDVTSSAAKVTLVKPLQEAGGAEAVTEDKKESAQEGDAAALSLARPKFGRAPTRPRDEYKPLTEPSGTEMRLPPLPQASAFSLGATRAFEDSEPHHGISRAWDSRFALFLLALFIAINLGLIALLHHGHRPTHNTLITSRDKDHLKDSVKDKELVSRAPAYSYAPPAAVPPSGLPPAAPGYPRAANYPPIVVEKAAVPVPATKAAPAVTASVAVKPSSVAAPVLAHKVAEAKKETPKAAAKPENSASVDLLAIINKD